MRRLLATILCISMVLCMMASCANGLPKDSETQVSTESESSVNADLVLTGASIQIVIPMDVSNAENEAALLLYKRIDEMTGVSPRITNDSQKAGKDAILFLVGETDHPLSQAARQEIDELEFIIRVEGNCIAMVGSGQRITAYAVSRAISDCLGYSAKYDYPLADTLKVPGNYVLRGSYYEATKFGKIIKYDKAVNPCVNRPTEDVQPAISALANQQVGAYYTGTTVKVDTNGQVYGGAQYVAKLFTEGLSRAPKGDEYLAYTQRIEKDGCTLKTLKSLALELFGGTEFASLQLQPKEMVFSVYRAILSRDPQLEELNASLKKSATEIATLLCDSAEFAQLLPSIQKGPYSWRGNATSFYTGTTVMTSAEVQALLNKNQTVSLPKGTLVLVSQEINIPDGKTLETEGHPTHYSQMARFIRVSGNGNYDMVRLQNNAVAQFVFADGNFNPQSDRIAGSNLMIFGNGASIQYCRCSDAGCTYCMSSQPGTEFSYMGHNLVTLYSSDHTRTWSDGVRTHGAESILEYNEIVDATDAAIAVFRYISNLYGKPGSNTYIRAQNTIVRYNTIIQAGNSSYASLDFESNNINMNDLYIDGTNLNVTENPANFTGCVFYENAVWTSMLAHTHLVVPLSTQPWTKIGYTDRAFGGSVCNNYTPVGCHICTASGICADGNTDAFIHGNRFNLYIGEWCGGAPARIYSVHLKDSNGDFQTGFEDKASSGNGAPFIASDLPIETASEYVLKEAWLYEEPTVIPQNRFLSK